MAEITIKDIAKQCGVGISTVSRAINNHPDINPKTRKMVMQVIEETGFIPNNSARNLKRTDAKCIAVLVKGITNPFFSSMIQIIEEETQKNKYALHGVGVCRLSGCNSFSSLKSSRFILASIRE